jgi:hypothetical protein
MSCPHRFCTYPRCQCPDRQWPRSSGRIRGVLLAVAIGLFFGALPVYVLGG